MQIIKEIAKIRGLKDPFLPPLRLPSETTQRRCFRIFLSDEEGFLHKVKGDYTEAIA